MKYFSLLLLMSLLLSTAALADKPQPPPQLSLFFGEIVQLEDAYSDGDWQRAGQTADELHEIYATVAPLLREQVGETLEHDFAAALSQLEEAIAAQNKNRASKSLIAVQAALFKAMDGYAYMVHPVVLVIDQYLDEAMEASERNDFSRVGHELEEIGSFLGKVGAVLEDKGVGAGMQTDFKRQLEQAEEAIGRKDQAATLRELAQLKKISKAFVWMATQ